VSGHCRELHEEESILYRSARRSTLQKSPKIVRNSMIQYRNHKNPPLALVPSQLNLVHLPHPISLTSILILSYHQLLGLFFSPSHSGFSTKTLYSFFFSSVLHCLSISSCLTSYIYIYIYIYKNVLSVCARVPLCPQISESASPMALEFGYNIAGEYARG
jgi:hypothetical protein